MDQNDNSYNNRNEGNRGDRNRNRGFNRPKSNKEWKLIERLVMSAQDEQRKARRWGIFFKFATLGYLIVALMLLGPSKWGSGEPNPGEDHTAVVKLDGIIKADSEANAARLIKGLRAAFKAKHSKGVLLEINSPGGSPVQAGMVYREIRRLEKEYPKKKLYAVITDIGASGAYYVAAAADEIYADPASLVGSIGVISEGFGYVGAMQKLGIERRVYTSGVNKAMLDPFEPVDPKQKEYFSSILNDVHQQFIDAVKEGRGNRLKDDPTLFTGLFWSGRQALNLGLIDGLASPSQVARKMIGAKKMVDYTPPKSALDSLVGKLGVTMADHIMTRLGIGTIQLR